jgi:hypothetical protein
MVPAGLPLSGPEKSGDFRPSGSSIEAVGSEKSGPLATGLSGQLVTRGTACPGTTAAYAGPPLVGPS